MPTAGRMTTARWPRCPVEAALQFIRTGHAEAVRDPGDEAAVLAGVKGRKA